MESTMSEDAVLVEHPDRIEETMQESNAGAGVEGTTQQGDTFESQAGPGAVQIVSIGTEENAYAFTFHEERLNRILSKIPPGWKVAVVSVVGAFRTGKSFLLSWFLRYLHCIEDRKDKEETSSDKKWYESFTSLGNDGFDWRGGSERNTTGIWLWSEPHFVKKESGDQLAVLLVDTQGMFDHETTMALTASIFGLSTLLSSYQIYNVDKRIQEDNLQQLALFSEYARTAMTSHDDEANESASTSSTDAKPFQKIEFLVRDWQNFEDEDDFDLMEKEMTEYLEKAIAEREAKDLQETREQIVGCFEDISCFGFMHPGIAVTKKKFTGDVHAMDETFLKMLDRYCRRVFDVEKLAPKIIYGRELTAVELGSYIKAYASLFVSGASFPEAATLLEATSTANNTNAVYLSIEHYKKEMDELAGPKAGYYMKPEELEARHDELMSRSATLFKSIAKFGNKKRIEESRMKLDREVQESFRIYKSLNESRNPLAGIEMYLIPSMIAFTSYILRSIADTTCSSWSTVCRKGSDVFAHMYAVVLCFMAILLVTRFHQFQGLAKRIRTALALLFDGGKSKQD